MDAAGVFWHVLNFFAPAVGMGALVAALAKVLWRKALAGLTWLKLALRVAGFGAVTLVIGLVFEGRDGRMSTYLALVLVNAATLWWSLWRAR